MKQIKSPETNNCYNIMRLTLTVPHYPSNGFRGNRVYNKEIIQAFDYLRIEKTWNQYVFDGVYSVHEGSNNLSDLHFHIHALLLVHATKDNINRLKLHQFILQKWNSLTVNPDNPRVEINEETAQIIIKSNKLLTMKHIADLNPQGTTFITLETLCLKGTQQKIKVNRFDSLEMSKAISKFMPMHFERLFMNEKTENIYSN